MAPWIVIVAAKAEIALIEYVNVERVPGRDYYPNSYIELPLVYQHWILYIFLNHPSFLCIYLGIVTNWFIVTEIVLRVRSARVT